MAVSIMGEMLQNFSWEHCFLVPVDILETALVYLQCLDTQFTISEKLTFYFNVQS